MIIKCNDIKNIKNKNSILDRLIKDSFFFDIETTGLSHKYSNIISITLLLYEENKYRIYQLYCEYKIDEKEAIKYFKDLIKNKKYVITYNGNTFDIPFVINKSLEYEINLYLNNFVKIDLYNDMRNLKNKIEISDLKLKTVESYFNINRNDIISGKDVTILYEAYKIEPRKEFSDMILEHNYEDVYNLSILFDKVLSLYDHIIIHKNVIIKINFDNLIFKKNQLICNFNIISNLKSDYLHPSLNFDISINIKSQNIKIKIPLYFFKNDDIQEFFYLHNENYNITDYDIIEGIKKNLIPIKYNNKVYNNNVILIIKEILSSII